MISKTFTVRNLFKTFDNRAVLKNISFSVSPGEIFGLLGPNGAGKTTLLRILMNLVARDKGEIRLDGRPHPDFLPGQAAYMPEERGLYTLMKVEEHLTYFGRLKGLSCKEARLASQDVMEHLGLEGEMDKRVEQLSKGNQQKVQLAIALLTVVPLTLLDEPFLGLDPLSMVEVATLLKLRASSGCIFIISSHQLDQMQKLCDSMLLIEHGQTIWTGRHKDVVQSGMTLEDIFLQSVRNFRESAS